MLSPVLVVFGEAIGRPNIIYIRANDDQVVKSLGEAGLSTEFAQLYVEMTHAFNERKIHPVGQRNAQNTTPTSFEDFAVEFAQAYQAA